MANLREIPIPLRETDENDPRFAEAVTLRRERAYAAAVEDGMGSREEIAARYTAQFGPPGGETDLHRRQMLRDVGADEEEPGDLLGWYVEDPAGGERLVAYAAVSGLGPLTASPERLIATVEDLCVSQNEAVPDDPAPNLFAEGATLPAEVAEGLAGWARKRGASLLGVTVDARDAAAFRTHGYRPQKETLLLETLPPS